MLANLLKLSLSSAILFSGLSGAHAEFYKYGNAQCEKCSPDEYLEIVHDRINHGEYAYVDDPACGDISTTSQALASAVMNGLKAYNGAGGSEAFVGSLSSVANSIGIHGEVGNILNGYANSVGHAACKAVCGSLPPDATVTGNRVQVEGARDGQEGQMFTIKAGEKGEWTHVFYPVASTGAVCVVVSNWSHNKDRNINFFYWFKTSAPLIEER